MGDPATTRPIGYEAYLAIERETDRRHEWHAGEVFAMAGGTPAHGALAVAVASELRALALECGCQVFSSDVKVRVRATGLATYPDASAVCGAVERDPDDRVAINNPAVLVEVLSEGTEAYDRGDKFAHYRELPSLLDYVLVSQHEQRIEVYSRDPQGLWVLREARAGQSVPVAALRGSLDVARVYAGIELEAALARVWRVR